MIFEPAYLSDFINSRQLRNLTVSGKKELKPIIGQYFFKPLVELTQSLNPTILQLHNMYFKSFDGIVINGEARGIARFADLIVYGSTFIDGNSNAIKIHGPEAPEGPEPNPDPDEPQPAQPIVE